MASTGRFPINTRRLIETPMETLRRWYRKDSESMFPSPYKSSPAYYRHYILPWLEERKCNEDLFYRKGGKQYLIPWCHATIVSQTIFVEKQLQELRYATMLEF